MSEDRSFRRVLTMMTGTSLLVPLVGVITAPILAQSLGVDGRGEAAAALAPNTLVATVATLGLPEALTYHLARRPEATRRALGVAGAWSLVLGLACLATTAAFAGKLAGGDPSLARLITLATLFAVPALLVNLLRGAASGRQMWREVAIERVANSLLRLFVLSGLALFGILNVLQAVLVMSLAPVLAGTVYWRLFRQTATGVEVPGRSVARPLIGFGSKVWLGAVASMLTARLSQLLVTPLSNVEQLGLLVVAITISDVPFIVATAVRDVVFGVNSHRPDKERLAATSRTAALVALVGSVVIGVSLPLWIGLVFGQDFQSATVPTLVLLGAAVVNVPGLIAGAGLSAWGRPILRSSSLLVALCSNLMAFLLLVPRFGALGAAFAGLISGVTVTAFSVIACSRVVHMPMSSFLWPRKRDCALILREVTRVLRLRAGRWGSKGDRVLTGDGGNAVS